MNCRTEMKELLKRLWSVQEIMDCIRFLFS